MRNTKALLAILALLMATFTGSGVLDAAPAAAISNCHSVHQFSPGYMQQWNGNTAAWTAPTRVAAGPCRDVNIQNRGYASTQVGSMYRTGGCYRLAYAGFGPVGPGHVRVTVTNIRAGTLIVTGVTSTNWPIRVAT